MRAYFWRGLYSEGLIYGGKFAFTLYLRAIFQVQYIWRGDLTEAFLRHRFGGGGGGLIFGGAYTWEGLFSELYGIYSPLTHVF